MLSNGVINNQQQLEELSPKRIGFLGGSFNPVHEGHIALVEYVLEHHVDYIVFCPHSLHPNKKEILVSIEHRVNMIQILKEISRYAPRMLTIHPSYLEGTHGTKFISLCEQLNRKGFYTSIICGIDCFSRPYPEYLYHFDHYIGIRSTGCCEEKIRELISGKIVFFETPFPTLSSTEIRAKVSDKRMYEIHEQLREYIRENRLFQ